MNSNDASPVFRLIRGPIMLILLGTLFAMEQFTSYGFSRTWPVLIIAFGVLKLLERVGGAGGSRDWAPPGGAS